MKQIFDWLREQMQNRIAYNESCHEEFKDSKMALTYEVQQNAWKNALAMVDEAEAKCSDIEQDAYQRGYALGFDNGYKDGQFFEKAKWEAVTAELENELKLADEEKGRCSRENPLQFDTAKGYATGISNAIEIVRKGGVE